MINQHNNDERSSEGTYNYYVRHDSESLAFRRKAIKLLGASFGFFSGLRFAPYVYNAQKNNDKTIAVLLCISVLISEGCASVWTYLKVEDELLQTVIRNDQTLSKESNNFKAAKHITSIIFALLSSTIFLITESKERNFYEKLIAILNFFNNTIYILYGYYLIFNYGKAFSNTKEIKALKIQYRKTINSFMPSIYLNKKGEFPEIDRLENIPEIGTGYNLEWFTHKLSENHVAPDQPEFYKTMKVYIPYITFGVVSLWIAPNIIFSAKDFQTTLRKNSWYDDSMLAVYLLSTFPAYLALSCYIINKVSSSLLDLFYAEQASDYITRRFPGILGIATFLGFLFAIGANEAYNYDPNCPSLEDTAHNKSALFISMNVIISVFVIITNTYTFLDIVKSCIKSFLTFSKDDDTKKCIKYNDFFDELKSVIKAANPEELLPPTAVETVNVISNHHATQFGSRHVDLAQIRSAVQEESHASVV